MNEKPYKIIDGMIVPQKGKSIPKLKGQVSGDYWMVWIENSKFFLEYDEGHFATKMVTVEISKREYDIVIDNPANVNVAEIINGRIKK